MPYDVLIRGGQVLDGTGTDARIADVAINGDRIVAIETLPEDAAAGTVIEAAGMVVAPGFVNMLSHAYYSLLQDGRGLSDLMQGVTTEVFSEEPPVGALTPEMQARATRELAANGYDVEVTWRHVSEYLDVLQAHGSSMNVATFVSSWALRENGMGLDQRNPTSEELAKMARLVEEEMEGGAFGIGSALIYPPASYTTTAELIELCRAAARFGGRYHSHIRSEGNGLLEAIQELLDIGEQAELPVELHHLKIAGRSNWHKLDDALQLLDSARAIRPVSCNMYTFNAGGTAVYSAIPPRFHDGGIEALRDRLRDRRVRDQIRDEIQAGGDDWENLYQMCGGADGVLLLMTEAPRFKPYCGQTLQAIADELALDPLEVLMDISQEDETRAAAAYFMISEDNVRRQMQVPWVAFGSDAGAAVTELPFTRHPTHPREYGNFVRVLETYVRNEGLVSLPEAIRRLSSLPCETLGLRDRGRLAEGYDADVVVFDLEKLHAPASYTDSHQYATGVRDVVVNGTPALRSGQPTGALPGRVLYGPGRA